MSEGNSEGTVNTSMNTDLPPGCGCSACLEARNNPGYNFQSADTQDAAYVDTPQYINNITEENSRHDDLLSGSAWNQTTLYYNFVSSLPSYYIGSQEATNFQAFTASMQTATREIMTEIGKLVNISFIETTNINQTDMVFGQAQLDPDAGAWAYYPGSYAQAGDVWTNIQYASSTQDMTKGGYGYYVLWHEIGHALGLQHTFEAFNLAYDNNAIENTEQYSVMAYNWSTWGNTFAESYMLYDIAALQEMYGANTTHASHSGNNTYVLRSGDAYAIWDGGGTDTLDGSAISSAMTLRLEEGQFSSVGLTDNITIAWNTIIENATGGSGNDQIYGNSANNILLGNAGADTLYASTGSDTLNGGDGTDTANYTSYSLMDFFFNFVNATTVTLNHLVDGWTDTLIAIENYVFGGTTYTRAELEDVAPSDLDIIHVGFSNGSGGYEYYAKMRLA